MPTPTSLIDDAEEAIWRFPGVRRFLSEHYAEKTGLHDSFQDVVLQVHHTTPTGRHVYDVVAVVSLEIAYANTNKPD